MNTRLDNVQAEQAWQWHFDQENQRLALDLDADLMFVSALGPRQLIADGFEQHGFAVPHARDYHHYLEMLESRLGLGGDMAMQISLNAVAAKYFHRPLMPKSWFFQSAGASQARAVEAGQVVRLASDSQIRHYFVVESDTNASLLLLIERDHQLSGTKSIGQFSVIKVMNDRLLSLASKSHKAASAA